MFQKLFTEFDFETLVTWTLNTCAFLAASINLILMILILTKSPKAIGTYKHLMIYIAFLEFTYAICYVASKPEIFTRGCAFFILTNLKQSIFPVSVSPWMDVIFIGFYGLSMALLAVHFIYRYLAVSQSELLESFQNWKLILWLLFPVLNAAVWVYDAHEILASTEDSDRFLEEFYLPKKKNGTKMEDLYYGGPYYYVTDKNGNAYINWKSFEGTLIILSLITLSFTTMIVFGVKCYKTMTKMIGMSSVSGKYKTLQSQLFNALVFQTIIPVFLMHIPATAIYISILFSFSSEIYGEILTITIAMYPVLNPLPTIFIVKSYREAVMDFLLCRKPKVEVSAIPQVSVFSQTHLQK